jgi:O-antigen/teichoic acid export membrane protein
VAVTSYLQTVNAVATAVGRQKFPVIALLVALAVRIALCAAFTAIPQIGIMGAVLASVISLTTALLICVRFVLPHGAVARACVDVGVISLWSIICVLGGFWLYKPIGGRAFFVVATLLTVAIYLLPAAIGGVKMKIKGQT